MGVLSSGLSSGTWTSFLSRR